MHRPARGAIVLALLSSAMPAAAQPSAVGLPSGFADVVSGCPAVPTLVAVGGGGRIELRQGAEPRIPYGVRYRFRHRLPAGTDFAIVTLALSGEAAQRVGFRSAAADSACLDIALPPLPMDRSVTLMEARGMLPTPVQVEAMLRAVDALRDAFFRRLYAGDFGNAIGEGRLAASIAREFPDLLPGDELRELVVLRGEPAAPAEVLGLVRQRFIEAAGRIAGAPHDIQAGADLAASLSQMLAGTPACQDVRSLTSSELARLQALSVRLQRLREVSPPAGLGALYENVLPVPPAEVEGLGAALTKACPRVDSRTLDTYVATAVSLTRDELGPVMAVIREARRLVQESFTLTATDAFAGATTTLQRYGQLDVVNAFFFGRDEVRLLATFSIYPGSLRFGGEIQPHGNADRLLLTFGYSLATPVSDEAEDEKGATMFAFGAAFRLNPFFSVGAGRWLGAGERGWYTSVAGDLGAVPFLKELFARAPQTPR